MPELIMQGMQQKYKGPAVDAIKQHLACRTIFTAFKVFEYNC